MTPYDYAKLAEEFFPGQRYPKSTTVEASERRFYGLLANFLEDGKKAEKALDYIRRVDDIDDVRQYLKGLKEKTEAKRQTTEADASGEDEMSDTAASAAAPKAAKKKAAKAKAKKPAAKKAAGKKAAAKEIGPRRDLAQKLYPIVKENPRREGTDRHKSLAIVIKKPGITFGDYLKAGGVALHLTYDISKGYVKA